MKKQIVIVIEQNENQAAGKIVHYENDKEVGGHFSNFKSEKKIPDEALIILKESFENYFKNL